MSLGQVGVLGKYMHIYILKYKSAQTMSRVRAKSEIKGVITIKGKGLKSPDCSRLSSSLVIRVWTHLVSQGCARLCMDE